MLKQTDYNWIQWSHQNQSALSTSHFVKPVDEMTRSFCKLASDILRTLVDARCRLINAKRKVKVTLTSFVQGFELTRYVDSLEELKELTMTSIMANVWDYLCLSEASFRTLQSQATDRHELQFIII